MVHVWQYGAAAAASGYIVGLVGIVKISGIITQHTAALILSDCATWIRQKKLVAHVADCSRACMTITPADLATAMQTMPHFDIPVAVVACECELDAWHEQSTVQAQHGLCRAAFPAIEPALRWAGRHGPAYHALRDAPA